MNELDLEREIRATFRRRGVDVLGPVAVPPVRQVLRHTRRRQVTTIATAVVVAVAVVAASVAGIGALIRSSERRTPIGPDETPAPSSIQLLPAVVTGSALDGYVRTAFPAVGFLVDLAVAPDGTLWAAGYQRRADEVVGSVFRFDGETWTTYTSDDGLPRMPRTGHARLNSVEVAPDGTVWAGTDLGLARLDGETWAIVSPPVSVGDIAFAPDGSLVAQTGSAPGEAGEKIDYALAGFDGTWTPWQHDFPSSPTALDVDPVNGSVWVGTGGGFGAIGSVSRNDGSGWATWLEPGWLFGGNVADLVAAHGGAAWVLASARRPGTREFGYFDRFEAGVWAAVPLPDGVGINWPWNGMALGPGGTIWAAWQRPGGNHKLVLLSFDGSSWTKDPLGPGIPTLDVTPDGTIWVGVGDSLIRFTPTAE